MRERPQHLEFPALRFLRKRREANRRRLRLRHLILLLLRCAAVLLFALAVARPVFQSAGFLAGGQAPVAAAIVIDTRPRMLYRHHNQTRLEEAQQLASQILQELPRESDIVVLDSSGSRSRFDVDRGAAAQKLEQLTVTYAGQDLNDTLETALNILKSSDKPSKEVFVLTDMAAADWRSPNQIRRWKEHSQLNPDSGLYVVDVGVADIENFALGDLEISHEVLSENGLLRVGAQATTDGRDGERTVQLFLEGEDGQLQKKGEQTVDCRAGQMSGIDFKTTLDGLGTHQGHVRFVRSDNLSVDDIRYFTVRVQAPWHILVVAPPPAAQNARLLTRSLAPLTLRRRGEAQFEFDIVDRNEFDQMRLNAYDAIWLLDPQPLTVAAWNRLTSYVSAGGGLALTLGGQAGMTGSGFNATASMELLPGELKRQWKNYDLYLAPERLEHPVLQKFKSREGDIPWAMNPILKIWELGPLAEGTQTVIRYSDQRPALLARNVGAGRVLVMTTPLGSTGRSSWNQLLAPKEEAWPGFVLVNGMADYLVGSSGQRLNFAVGESVLLSVDNKSQKFDSYLLKTPDGNQRVKAEADQDELLIAGTETAGQYRIEAGGRQGVRYGFSANVTRDTTRLERIDEQELRAELEGADIALVSSMDQLRHSRKVAVGRSRWEAYSWLIALLVLVVAAENLLSTFFYRHSAPSTGPLSMTQSPAAQPPQPPQSPATQSAATQSPATQSAAPPPATATASS
ncbi:MAG: BatA domain-containing protein, partial [Pirellulales bacterium]